MSDTSKDVLSTFEAAKICNVHFETIKNWIRKGTLKSYKTPGGHNRIKREDLNALMHANNFPVPGQENKRIKILISITNYDMFVELSQMLRQRIKGVEIEFAPSPFLAGAHCGIFQPDVFIVSGGIVTKQDLLWLASETHCIVYSNYQVEGRNSLVVDAVGLFLGK